MCGFRLIETVLLSSLTSSIKWLNVCSVKLVQNLVTIVYLSEFLTLVQPSASVSAEQGLQGQLSPFIWPMMVSRGSVQAVRRLLACCYTVSSPSDEKISMSLSSSSKE